MFLLFGLDLASDTKADNHLQKVLLSSFVLSTVISFLSMSNHLIIHVKRISFAHIPKPLR
jgi:hypothetical protein